MRSYILIYVVSALMLFPGCTNFNKPLLTDDFKSLDTGLFSAPVGPHTEYHYLAEAGIKGNWVVSSFASGGGGGWGTAWQIKNDGSGNMMCQTYLNKSKSTHPMVIAGDSLWRNYKLKVVFRPENDKQSSGVAFRYRNDRCFYFFGIKDSSAYISVFNHATNQNSLNEKILAEKHFAYTRDTDLIAEITVDGNSLKATLNGEIRLEASDSTYLAGKIGLVSNARAQFKSVEVLSSSDEIEFIQGRNRYYQEEALKLQSANRGMVVWKKLKTTGFGVGRNIRFGDLNNDGEMDLLIGQVVHHGPSDSHSELSCLTAMTFDGEILWQKGAPDPEKNHLTNDVGFQIHDFDNDGKNEVIYCMNFELIVADALTGKTKYKTLTPVSKIENDKFQRILGDCLFFFDAEGKGRDENLLIKDRYTNFWVLDNKLKVIWEESCKTGHYPYAYDIDNDGKDELAIGYSLYDHDGKLLWCLDKTIGDHADGVAVVNFSGQAETEPVIMYSASNAGYARTDLNGNLLKQYFIGHVQNPAVANFRSDKPGLETVSINFWGNQGIQHFYDADGNVYHDFEPNQFGSMCLPLNWTGKEEEFYVHNPNIREGGVFDGWGRKVLAFPDDGHPDMCNAVLDITGDCRDEIVVWNPDALWVYTQSDNPKKGRLYKPLRNPLYNYSNYQATVSLPGWNE
jgi:rhamnogalacturonan endolyase